MRLFVVCLLSLGVAVQGYASVRVMESNCPMLHADAATAHGQHAGMDHAGMDHSQMDHMSQGQDGSPGHGKPCQHDVGCQSAGLAIVSSLIVPVSTAGAPRMPVAPASSFRSHTPPLLARPPALA